MNIEKFIGDLNKEYEDYIVGFADILGFKNKIAENEGNPLEISALCYVMSECVKQTDLFNEIDVRLFSDCLYVFGKKERFLDIVKLLTWLTASLFNVIPRRIDAQKGIENYVGSNLLRGGVTYGRALIGNNIFFGPAINEAYNIESNIAKYPRIVFSETVWSAVEKPGYIKKTIKERITLILLNHIRNFMVKRVLVMKHLISIYRR